MSKQQRKIRARRRRHAQATRRVCTTGGLAVAATLLTGTVANAATITVTTNADTGAGSLRAAITTANGTTAADTITFASTVTQPIVLASALPQITEPLTITGNDTSNTVISGQNKYGIFSVAANTPTEIDDLQMKSGKAVNGAAVDVTGTGSPLTLIQDYLTGNQATGSSGNDGGGAVYSDSPLTVSRDTLSFNTAAGDGGAIDSVAGASTVSDDTLYDNTALKGGAVAALTTSGSTITGSTIVKNVATGTGNRGGGIYAASGDAATIDDTIAYGNTATTGSDVSVATGGTAPTTAFSLFGTLSGSGITTPPSSDIVGTNPDLNAFSKTKLDIIPKIGSPVIDQGKAFGLASDEPGNKRPIDLPDVPNATGGDGSDIGAIELTAAAVSPVVNSQSEYIGKAGDTLTLTGSNLTGVTSVTFGTTSVPFTIVNDGEITVTVPMGSGTEAITVSNPDASAQAPGGFSYPGPTFTVTNTADSGPGSLRDAINQANTDGGADEITFASGLTGTITLASNLPEIDDPVTIVGPGAANLTVNGAGKYSLLDFNSHGPSSVSGLTITDGAGTAVDATGSLTLTGDSITNSGGTSTYGGGVDAEYLTVDDSTISGNHAYYEGGFAADTATITDSTISGNTASYSGAGFALNLYLNDSTVAANTATGETGGVGGFDETIIGSTIVGNSLSGVTSYDGTLTLEDSVVSGSTGTAATDVYARDGGTAAFSLIGVNGKSGSYGVTTDGTDIIGKDPMLGPLQNNGGPTQTMVPLPGSPLLDAGKAFGLTTDQRGLSRTVDLSSIANALGGDATDIGAVEMQLPAVTGVSPATGAGASTVTISGAGFTGATQVLFGSTPATSFTVTNDEQITATVPAGSGTVDVHVVGPYGQSATASADQFSYPAPPTTTTTTPPPTTTTNATPTPTPKPATSTHKATFDNQQLVLTLPATSACTKPPATVTLSTTAIKKSKAQKLTFVKAAIYVDKGVKHTRKVKVHGKTRTVTTYTPNVTVRKASSTSKLTGTKGRHTLKTVISYRERVTRNHKTRTVTVTKTLTGTLNLC